MTGDVREISTSNVPGQQEILDMKQQIDFPNHNFKNRIDQ